MALGYSPPLRDCEGENSVSCYCAKCDSNEGCPTLVGLEIRNYVKDSFEHGQIHPTPCLLPPPFEAPTPSPLYLQTLCPLLPMLLHTSTPDTRETSSRVGKTLNTRAERMKLIPLRRDTQNPNDNPRLPVPDPASPLPVRSGGGPGHTHWKY